MKDWNEVTQIVLGDAQAAPMAFLRSLLGHLEHVDGAPAAIASALRDQANAYLAEAAALEAEGRNRGLNVVPMEGQK